MHISIHNFEKQVYCFYNVTYYTCAKEMVLTLKLLHDHTNTNCIRKVFTFKNIQTCIPGSSSIHI